MTKELSYADSEKFRAEAHKHIGYLFCTPLALDMLHFLVDGQIIELGNFSIEFYIAIVGYLIINNSYVIMRERDKKYVRKFLSSNYN